MFRYKIHAFASLLVMASLAFLSACSGDDDSGSSEVVLLSFGPSGVHHGEEITFVGQNFDKVTSVVFPPSIEISRSQFVSAGSGRFNVVVPDAAIAGKVILKTATGDIESKTLLNFEVPVTVSSIPAQAKPGTNITIKGTKLNWVESITFYSTVVVEQKDFVSVSDTELVVTVPKSAQTGSLKFVTGGTLPLEFTSETQLTVLMPTVTSFAPASARHTANVTITGTNLDLIKSISFSGGKTATQFVSQTETQLVVAVPAGSTKGKLTLKQASPLDVVTATELTIILPKATIISPKPATPGTDNISITGTDLDLVKKLTLAGVTAPISVSSANFISQTSTNIVLALPADAKNGAIEYTTIHDYSNSLGVTVFTPGSGPVPLDYYIYDDALKNGWSNWGGWNWDVKDLASTEQVLVGSKAIKITFNGQYGALQIGSPSTGVMAGYAKLSFQVYAAAGQNLIVQLNNDADSYLSIPAGWSLVQIPISNLAGNASVAELRIKNNNANLPATLYLDEIGFTY